MDFPDRDCACGGTVVLLMVTMLVENTLRQYRISKIVWCKWFVDRVGQASRGSYAIGCALIVYRWCFADVVAHVVGRVGQGAAVESNFLFLICFFQRVS